jgi:G3E family GTPase
LTRRLVVFAGFLGSGKTTLLSGLLGRPSARRAAVLVNEFGEVGLDHHLLRRAGGRVTLLGGGCVCCDGSKDLARALLDLLDEGPSNPVLLETSGLADPAGVMRAVLSHPVLRHHYAVGPVVTTVDAANSGYHLDQPEAVAQISAADVLVLTKTDLAGAEAARELAARLRALNPAARIVVPDLPGAADLEMLLRPGSGPEGPETPARRRGEDVPGARHGGHGAARSVSLTFDGPVDWAGFGIWLSMLLHARGGSVLRVKGLLDVGEDGPVVLDGVGGTVHPPRHLDAWPDRDRSPRLVFILRGTEPVEILASLDAFGPVLGARPRRLTAA